jgi:oxaloacetate decarboxylase gamma subunit
MVPVTDLLLEGLVLLVIGMGIVVSFLLLLVGVLTLTSRLVQHLAGPPVPQPVFAGPTSSDESEVVAAIVAALALYRARNPDSSQASG